MNAYSGKPIPIAFTTVRFRDSRHGARNSYGHPAKAVLDNLMRFGVGVYRTDRDGAIRYDLTTGAITVAAPNAQTGQPGPPGGRSTSRVLSSR